MSTSHQHQTQSQRAAYSSTPHNYINIMSFGTEILGNQMRGNELSEPQRVYILAQTDAGVPTREIADALSCLQRAKRSD
jgi:hypothetical protein